MDPCLKKIVEMLQSEDSQLQCAAAMVLGELRPAEKVVSTALGKALASTNARLRMCALDAIAKIGGAVCIPAVLPLLKEQGEIRQKAIATLTALGPSVVKQLKGELEWKDRALKMAIIKIIVSVWGKDALKTLFTCLFDPDLEVVRCACDAVRAQADKMDARQRAELFKETADFLRQKKAQENRSAVISALRLLGYSRHEEAKAILLRFIAPENDAAVRRHALVSLRHIPYRETGNDELIRALFALLGEKDFQNIVSSALEVLKGVKIPDKFCEQCIRLLDSEHSAVRLFAIRALADQDSAEAAKRLSDLSNDKDPAIREAAAAVLARNPAAVGNLLKRLASATTPDEAWTTARILRGHADHLKPATVKSLTARMFELLEKESDLYRPHYYLVSAVAPEQTYKALLDRGLRHTKAKRLALAERCLQLIPDAPNTPPEAKYHLASVRLKLSPKSLAKADRERDVCLKQFADLARREGFDLLTELKKNRLLGAEDLLYLGFHFVEEAEPLHKVGREILSLVAQKWPRSKVGRDARTKLETESAPPPAPSDIPEVVKKKVESMW